MDLYEQIEQEAKKYFEGVKGVHEWSHVDRVYKLAMRIGKKEGANLNIIKLAALLHDIGRLEETDYKTEVCHAERGAEIARDILKKYDVPEDVIEQVAHCIRTHRYRRKEESQTKEAKVLFDADKLDVIGAIGIARNYYFAGQHRAKLHNDPGVDVEKTEEYTEEGTGYREYLFKLRYVKDKMFTEEGKKIAQGRHNFIKEFYDRFLKEVEGEF